MRNIEITENQVIQNKINSRSGFTHEFGVEANKRYVVGCYSIYEGRNPSINTTIHKHISEALENKDYYDSIGSWFDTEGKTIVTVNQHFNDISQALKMAKLNNQLSIYDKTSEQVLYLTNYKNR
tara:strand:- start:411 stop:782 length:372 start_codon:yes stop_codon:yes gene_type:complete